MGEVYRADDLVLDQAVALKLLSRTSRSDSTRLDACVTEVKLARRITHPHVCRVYDITLSQGAAFLSMELVEGEDLASRLKRTGPPPPALALELARQLCQGLAAAHDQGVLHRDLKPANVLIDHQDKIRITDFGIAVLAEDPGDGTRRSGTPAYMAPEQHQGQPGTVASEIYTLGLVLYEIFTGRRPFEAELAEELAWRHCSVRPVPPSSLVDQLDEALEKVILHCLEKAPGDRPSSARKVAEALSGDACWRPAPGLELPQRRNWRIERKLGEGGFGEVWLAAHVKTHEQRAFKFCFDAERLRALQREVTLFRLLKEELGHRDDIARILDWDLERPPYYVESVYTEGGSLAQWAETRGGAGAIALATRLEIVAQAATALAAAHSVGVLHKDVKPANVLICEHDGAVRVRLTDFGVGQLTDRKLLAEAGITALGFTGTETQDPSREGTRLYQAPELLEGKPATIQADVYALGVLLYQLLAGDFSRALAPGWEQDVDDELLRDDVAAVVDGSPERRLGNALRLAERLRSLDERRRALASDRHSRKEAERLRSSLARLHRRRRVMALAMVGVLLVSTAVGMLAWRLAREVERANREARSAERVAGFLVELFEVSNPYTEGEKAREHGAAITASELLGRGAVRVHESLGDEPEIQARLLHAIGKIYRGLGDYDAAEPMLTRALELRRQLRGEQGFDVLETLGELGELRRFQGRFREAEQLHRQVLEQQRRAYGEHHPEVAKSLDNLASALEDLGEFDVAEAFHREALAMRTELFGGEDLSVAESFNNLALLLGSGKGDPDAAGPLFREALRIYRLHYGRSHPTVATTSSNLGMVLDAKGEFEAAQALHREALDVRRRLLGDEHPDVAASLNNLAAVLEMQGEYEAAEPLYRDSLKIRRKVLGKDHPLVALTLNNLAFLYMVKGDFAASEPRFREALTLRRRRLGDDHPNSLSTRRNLARVLVLQGRFAEARRHYQEAVALGRQRFGDEHEEVARGMAGLGVCLHEMGELDQGKVVTLEALAMRRSLFGDVHPRVAESLEHLGRVLISQGDHAGAESVIRESLSIRRALWPQGHWRLAFTENLLGACLAGLGRFEQAEPLLVQGYGQVREQMGSLFYFTQRALRHVVSFYEATGDQKKVDLYRAKFVESR